MPRKTKRQCALESVLLYGTLEIVTSRNENETDVKITDTIIQYLALNSVRYMSPRQATPKSTEWYIQVLPGYDDLRFKCFLRMSRHKFSQLFGLIKDNKVFKCGSNRKMIPIELQLAIALYRFGSDGTGSSLWKVSSLFGISDGGIINIVTHRIIKVLLELKNAYIRWPEYYERQRIVESMSNTLPNCVGYLDGSHVTLFEAPLDDHESYFSRKQQYGIHIQAICDNNLLIRSLSVGYPASVHDARVFSNSPIGANPELFLSNGQWIAADSAYSLTEFVLTPFRENSSVSTIELRKKYNRYFASQRVKIEQTFGILKNIFPSLRGLRIRVDKLAGHKRACNWIVACCILYNIIRPEISDISEMHVIDADDLNQHADTPHGENKRIELLNWINNNV